jgi:hypothetical protein
MEINIREADTEPIDRVHAISIIIRSFKGRRDVEVHLFRPSYDESNMNQYDWAELIGGPLEPGIEYDKDSSKRIILEAFTPDERDKIVTYLTERYSDRVSRLDSCPLDLPIPAGLPPLSTYPEGKSIGFIRFDEIPNYPLDFTFRGLYDLSRHEPLVRDAE